MFGIGHMPELIALLVVALLILGPGKLPSVGGALGKTIREFKRETSEITDGINGRSKLPDRSEPSERA